MRYSIVYAAHYSYEADVTDQHNAIRVRPAQNETQRLEGFDVSVDPAARLHEHLDYFGTSVIQFGISGGHDRLSIRAESRVVAEEPPPPPEPGWEALRGADYLDAGAEYLGPLRPAADPARIEELAAAARGATPLETLRNVCAMIPDRFEYRPGVTYVGSTVDDLLAGGAGVCQDFTHLALTMLRHEGIAARYVSGYLFAPNGGTDGARGSESSAEVNTHAWVEALLPAPEPERRAGAWVAIDPTNRRLAGDDHVKIGHGRAYSDVPPIRGVYRGSADSSHEVRVTMTRIERAGERG